MAKIIPFKGVIYNSKRVGSLAKIVAPPYDIISGEKQNMLYRSSPYNVIRLELGKIKDSDSAYENQYTRAADLLSAWLKNKMLVQDEKDSIYIYSQIYKDGGRRIDRTGFIALMSLDEGNKKVLPHENTLLAPKMDRLDLMRKVKANLSPIFVLYEDAQHNILKILKRTAAHNKPFIDISFEGIKNRAWRLDDKSDIKKIQDIMRKSNTFIADGHHRFEVTRMYNKELLASGSSQPLSGNSGYVMVYFVESKEDMLTVLPAHRLPKDIGALKGEEIIERLKKYFIIDKAQSLNTMMKRLSGMSGKHAFGMHLGSGRFYLLKLKSMKPVDEVIKNKPKEWKKLDVSILHRFIFQHVLGIRDEDDNIEFVKSPKETASLVDKGDFKVAFFLNPTKVAEVKRIARIGEKMPRKATYFYPKPVSGIVINKH